MSNNWKSWPLKTCVTLYKKIPNCSHNLRWKQLWIETETVIGIVPGVNECRSAFLNCTKITINKTLNAAANILIINILWSLSKPQNMCWLKWKTNLNTLCQLVKDVTPADVYQDRADHKTSMSCYMWHTAMENIILSLSFH